MRSVRVRAVPGLALGALLLLMGSASAALALAKAGASVAVLEAGRVVGEASGRNGGHCNNGLAHDLGGLAASLGIERASALYRAFDAGVDTVEALVAREGIECDFIRTGKIKLAAKPGHFAKLEKSAELLQAAEAAGVAGLLPR